MVMGNDSFETPVVVGLDGTYTSERGLDVIIIIFFPH